jgi:hypothetical protein
MHVKAKNMIAQLLMVLILFSTIGVNIISTFCDGCSDEHISMALAPNDHLTGCECCEKSESAQQCCSIPDDNHAEKHHDTRSVFAKLTFDSPAAKQEVFNVETPVFLLHFVTYFLQSETLITVSSELFIHKQAPPLSGRAILQLVCVLRN